MRMFKGADAIKLLSQHEFVDKWKELQDQCPWKSSFQGHDFSLSWYESYTHAMPVLICEYGDNGDLVGLIPLAIIDASNAVVTGSQQAEYQAWLSSAECPVTFLKDTITMLIKNGMLSNYLSLKYLVKHPAMEPYLAQLNADLCLSIEHDRPLLLLNSEEIANSFKKKNNKSKFNRLKRMGELTFKRVTESANFAAIIDLIIAQYDFRQGAAHDSFPFFSDPNKREFHLAWFARNPDNFHITTMMLDDELVSALIGVVNGNSVSIAIITYSPLFSTYSPGKLHIMMLSQQLVEDGFEYLDLTPGGDTWKSRFADSFDTVYEYRIYTKQASVQQYCSKEKRLAQIKKLLSIIGVTPDQLRGLVSKVKMLSPSVVINKAASLLPQSVEMRFYRIDMETYQQNEPIEVKLVRNHFSDFVYFTSRDHLQTRQGVAATALSRLERGECCYTYRIQNKLAYFGWLCPKRTVTDVSEVGQQYTMPESSAVLYDFYTDDDARGQGIYQSAIRQMLADIKNSPETKYVYISVLADSAANRHVIEKIGFEYQESLVSKRTFGKFKSIVSQENLKDIGHE